MPHRNVVSRACAHFVLVLLGFAIWGRHNLVLSPPLVFTPADVDETARILHAAFAHAAKAAA